MRSTNAPRGGLQKRAWLCALVGMAALLLTVTLVSCGKEETTTTAAPATTAVTTATTLGPTGSTASTEVSTTTVQLVKGGKIRWILMSLPQVFYYPETSPSDHQGLMPGIERLLVLNSNRQLTPQLAESIEEDPDNLTFTIHVRKGVKLHDGSQFDASLLKWILEELKKAGKLNWGRCYESVEVKDPYTVVVHVSEWNNAMLADLGQVPVFSKEALDKNGVEWCRAHFVGTGPFMMKEFNRDQNLVWVRNPDYWQKDEGLPYLDEIEFLFIPDSNTAKTAMEAGEIDVWGGPADDLLSEMQAKGLVLQSSWVGRFVMLVPNLVDPGSPFQNQKVREALDYALDREALTEALGYGIQMPVYEFSAPGHWGYGAGASTKREYDPQKARQLLAEAGYPNGLSVNLLAMTLAGGGNIWGEAIKGYLDAAGFKVTLDIADAGRYFGSIFGTGWKDLVLFTVAGYNQANDLLDLAYVWNALPSATNWASWKPPQELANLFAEALVLRDIKAMEAKVGDIVALMSKEALVCPVSYASAPALMQPWVHINYPACGIWYADFAHAWVGKH